jgi:hypothetical protein
MAGAPNIRRAGAGIGNERGQATVEFALVLPLVLIVLFLVIDFGRAFNAWIEQTHLANEAVRWAVVDSVQAVAAPPALGSLSGRSVTFCLPPGSTGLVGEPVEARTTGIFQWSGFLSGVFGSATTTPIAAMATMRVEKARTNYSVTGTCPP